jgi:hypothetical protein
MYALRIGILKYILYFIIFHFDMGHKFNCNNVFVVFLEMGIFALYTFIF